MKFGSEAVQRQLVNYLTHNDDSGITNALKDWPAYFSFYASGWDGEMLQGDSWTGLPVRNFETGEQKLVKALVLSNSCAIDPSNKRDFPPRVVIAPLMPLAKLRGRLEESIEKNLLESKIAAIVAQKVNSFFYLPRGGGLDEDHIVCLDDVYSLPARFAVPQLGGEGKKLATLSQIGFYLLLFKLSIFFCRFQENVDRDTDPTGQSSTPQSH